MAGCNLQTWWNEPLPFWDLQYFVFKLFKTPESKFLASSWEELRVKRPGVWQLFFLARSFELKMSSPLVFWHRWGRHLRIAKHALNPGGSCHWEANPCRLLERCPSGVRTWLPDSQYTILLWKKQDTVWKIRISGGVSMWTLLCHSSVQKVRCSLQLDFGIPKQTWAVKNISGSPLFLPPWNASSYYQPTRIPCDADFTGKGHSVLRSHPVGPVCWKPIEKGLSL